MNSHAITVDAEILTIRSRGKYGGAIISCRELSSDKKYAVCINYNQLRDADIIQEGQRWTFSGSVAEKELRIPNTGKTVLEKTIEASRAILLQPSGDNIISFIAKNPNIIGVGPVKAKALYEAFGTDLADIIKSNDIEKLKQILSKKSALSICSAFSKLDVAQALLFLDKLGLPHTTGQKVIDFYDDQTISRISSDPYILLAFNADWKKVDSFAQDHCGIDADSKFRLHSAIEESLYRCFDNGSTAANTSTLRNRLRNLLESPSLIDQAIELGETNGQYYKSQDLYFSAGAFIMERYIVSRLKAMLKGNAKESQIAIVNLTPASINEVIANFEVTEGYKLTTEQIHAVTTSVSNRLSLILGGAGVGKTTVLKCIYKAIESAEPFFSISQVALAGKAAKRMTETTGMPAFTIASFLHNVAPNKIPENSWIIVDEASMVDVITLYKLLRHIPESCNLILVGDQHQLAPVGPGLTLHTLINTDIAQTTLTVVKRQSAASGIPRVAESIRTGEWPKLSPLENNTTGVSFIECAPNAINQNILEVYKAIGGDGTSNDVQILSMTRSGIGGVDTINTILHNTFRASSRTVIYTDEEFGNIEFVNSVGKFKLGDLVVYTTNDYARDLRNGSLGKISEIIEPIDSDSPVCAVVFGDKTVQLSAMDLENLELSYSLTVHKSQGSEFERVIIPIRNSRLLDRTMLYTAITRCVEQVVLVGDINAAKKALGRINANNRQVGIPHFWVNS